MSLNSEVILQQFNYILILYNYFHKSLYFLILTLLFIFVDLITSSIALANPSVSNSLNFFLDQSQMSHKRNKQLCFTYEDESLGLPCNPSFLGLKREPQFWISIFGNNNLKYFQDVAKTVNGPIDSDVLLSMINHNSNEHFTAGLSFGYMSENWGFNIVPERLVLFTHIRNPSLPRITLLASKETEVQFQLGSFFNTEWSWGLQARVINRSFVYNDSHFSDHFVDETNELYILQKHKIYLLEPSLLFAPAELNWNPTFSFTIDNLGAQSEKLGPYISTPKLRFGSSISSQLESGILQFGVTSHWINNSNDNIDGKFYSSLGINYSVSLLQLFLTLGEVDHQIGAAINYNNLSTSLTYSRQDWSSTSNQFSNDSHLWRWELGLKF